MTCEASCNIRAAGFGRRPTYRTGFDLVDAYFWVKPPGESDGCANQRPNGVCASPDTDCGLDDALGSREGEQAAPAYGAWWPAHLNLLGLHSLETPTAVQVRAAQQAVSSYWHVNRDPAEHFTGFQPPPVELALFSGLGVSALVLVAFFLAQRSSGSLAKFSSLSTHDDETLQLESATPKTRIVQVDDAPVQPQLGLVAPVQVRAIALQQTNGASNHDEHHLSYPALPAPTEGYPHVQVVTDASGESYAVVD